MHESIGVTVDSVCAFEILRASPRGPNIYTTKNSSLGLSQKILGLKNNLFFNSGLIFFCPKSLKTCHAIQVGPPFP
jgi:hypothetical protein